MECFTGLEQEGTGRSLASFWDSWLRTVLRGDRICSVDEQ